MASLTSVQDTGLSGCVEPVSCLGISLCGLERPPLRVQIQELEEGRNLPQSEFSRDEAPKETLLLCPPRQGLRGALQEKSVEEAAAGCHDL